MNCKNCNYSLPETEDRLSLKKLLHDFFNQVFGWENNYFRTLKTMIVAPDVVVSDYIDGIRKRHMSPITFLLIGLTIATLVFNMFSEKYIELNTNTLFDEDSYQTLFDPTGRKNDLTTPEEIKKYEEDFKTYKEEFSVGKNIIIQNI